MTTDDLTLTRRMPNHIIAQAGVPHRYEIASWGEVTPQILQQLHDYCENIAVNMRKGLGMTFVGPYGTGKTFAAVLAVDAALEAGLPPAGESVIWDPSIASFALAAQMSVVLHRPSAEGNEEQINHWLNVDLLVIDDWHKMYLGKEWDRSQLEMLMDVRHAEMRSTILTINDKSVFDLLPGVKDRLRENTVMVALPDGAPSRRTYNPAQHEKQPRSSTPSRSSNESVHWALRQTEEERQAAADLATRTYNEEHNND